MDDIAPSDNEFEEIFTELEESLQAKAKEFYRQYKKKTKDCLALSRILDIINFPTVISNDEHEHLNLTNCKYCNEKLAKIPPHPNAQS